MLNYEDFVIKAEALGVPGITMEAYKKGWDMFSKKRRLLDKVNAYEKKFPHTPLNRIVQKGNGRTYIHGIEVQR